MPKARGRAIALSVRLVGGTALYGAVLFVSAGTLRWPGAWGYLAVITGILVVYSWIILRIHPDLMEERARPPAGAKAWDKPFVTLIATIGPFVLLLASGLDHRFGWSPQAAPRSVIAGLVLVACGGALANYAVAVNRFFSALVRIQRERGHRVVDSGPYRIVRHPAYAGSILNMFGAALALGSRTGLGVAAVLTIVVLIRTALEDRTLHAELDGYAAYSRRVRFRLVPGVW